MLIIKKQLLQTTLLICFQVGSVFFVPVSGLAQQRSNYTTTELGVGLGGTTYKGEISPNYRFLNNRPALTVFYKKDVSPAIALRASLLAGIMRANDANTDLPLNQSRQAAMKTNLAELAIGIDYNFLNYYDQRQRIRWTPYFFLGAALTNFNNRVDFQNGDVKPFENGFVFSIPAGIGFKYALSYHWNLGLEVGARKTLFQQGENLDYLKKKSYTPEPPQELPYRNPYDRDWYFYNGLSLSYTFYKLICPDVYKENKNLLR